MDSLGASLEAEQRAKSEALRIKKKLESDINELEIALDHANKANSEGQKAIKRYQGTLRDTIQGYEDEARSRQQVMEQVGISERKANALSGEVEESRALWILPNEPRDNLTLNWLMPAMPSMKWVSLTPVPCTIRET